MATDTSSIDDILTNSNPNDAPSTPEAIDDNFTYDDTNEGTVETSQEIDDDLTHETEERNEDTHTETHSDEYGNAKAKPKTYTEDEVNERINKAVRERLARANNQPHQQPTQQQQLQQKAGEFEYDPESEGNWQQQLEAFVEQTFTKMSQKQAQLHQKQIEQAAEAEFVDKFSAGMERFTDFRDVVGSQPITDPMTLALRGVGDPAAFIYAASKRHPTELERISKLKDPYSQMVEMGKLEERMRKKPEGTKAPRPIGRSQEDSTMNYVEKKVKEDSIEDLIHKSEAKKMAKLRQLRGK